MEDPQYANVLQLWQTEWCRPCSDLCIRWLRDHGSQQDWRSRSIHPQRHMAIWKDVKIEPELLPVGARSIAGPPQ